MLKQNPRTQGETSVISPVLGVSYCFCRVLEADVGIHWSSWRNSDTSFFCWFIGFLSEAVKALRRPFLCPKFRYPQTKAQRGLCKERKVGIWVSNKQEKKLVKTTFGNSYCLFILDTNLLYNCNNLRCHHEVLAWKLWLFNSGICKLHSICSFWSVFMLLVSAWLLLLQKSHIWPVMCLNNIFFVCSCLHRKKIWFTCTHILENI